MSSVLYTFTSFTTSNSYIVKPFNDEKCFIVDLPPDLDNVIEFIKNNNLTVAGALITHGHYDHSLGLSSFEGKAYINLDDEFIISENAWRMSRSGYSSMFIMLNDKVSVEDLLRGVIVVSGNDACVALAEGIAGTEENFAEIMNEKASEIGLMNTNFTNSSGINDPDNYSTVRDIAIMSKYLIKN